MADLVTRDDLPVKLPTMVGGTRQTAVIARSPEQAQYAQDLESRGEAIRARLVQPDQDNMLLVSPNGRAAALDQQLVGLPSPADGGKPSAITANIMRIHHQHENQQYLGADGTLSPVTGGLQIVFLDQSTPKPGQWNLYRQIRDELAAIHHADMPWRPDFLEQREGRAIRQGNQNDQVDICTYVAENTFDAYSWNLIAVKAKFIAQVRDLTRNIADWPVVTAAINAVASRVTPTAGDAFHATLHGKTYTERTEAGRDMAHHLAALYNSTGTVIAHSTDMPLGRLGGLDLHLKAGAGSGSATISIDGIGT